MSNDGRHLIGVMLYDVTEVQHTVCPVLQQLNAAADVDVVQTESDHCR